MEKKINLKKELVGKTLYLNNRRFFEVWDALYVPRHDYWVFIYGRGCGKNDYNTFMVINKLELQLLVAGGTFYSNKVLTIEKREK